MAIKINAYKLKVQNALLRHPELRDDDRQLMAYLWRNEIRNAKDAFHRSIYTEAEIIIIEKFLRKFSIGKYSHGPTIKRIRAKLQEDHKKLRGKRYYERKGLAVDWRTELGYKTRYDTL